MAGVIKYYESELLLKKLMDWYTKVDKLLEYSNSQILHALTKNLLK